MSKKIVINYDCDKEIMEITQTNNQLFYGNLWDFDRTPDGLKDFLESCGLNVEIIEKDFDE